MLKEQVFKILEKNYSKVCFDNELVSYKTILESDIHPSIKNYIKSELKILFSRDKALIKKKSVFNYSSVKIDFFFSQIFDELVKSTFISSEEANNLLLQAISFNLSHLIKPNWSLKKIIFNDKKNISSSDFFYLIEYAYFYPYQKNIVKKYFKKLDLSLIDSEKFEEILNKIDLKLFRENKREILSDFYNTSLEFTDTFQNNNLQTEIILAYLTDKGLSEEYSRIKQFIENNKTDKMSKAEFDKIIFDDLDIQSQSQTVEDNKQDSFINEEKIEISDSNTMNEKNDNILSDNNTTIGNNSNKNQDFTLFDEELLTEDYEKNLEKDSELESAESNNLGNNSASDLLKYLSEKEIQRIQENLFNSDSEDFVFVIEKIISAPSFDDSLRILNEIAQSYYFDLNSKEINLLKAALQKLYKG